MPQEPITKYFNLQSPSEAELLVNESIKNKPSPEKAAALAAERKKMNGTEFKGFANEKMNEQIRKRNELWLRAAYRGDTEMMRRLEKQFPSELKGMLATGTISEMEFKVLAPMVEGTNSAGGYNAPPAYVGDLARNLAKYAICRNHFRIQAMKSWKENIPYLINKLTVAPTAEMASIAASTISEGNLQLTAYKAAAITSASNEMLEDANFPLWAANQDIAWEQFGIQEDQNGLQDLVGSYGTGALYYGDGTLASNGAITANGAIGIWRGGATNSGKTGFPQIGDAGAAKDAWSDLLYMLASQPSGYFQGGKFFIDQQVAIAMFSMRDSQYRFIADIVNGITVEMGLDGQPKTYFKGYEIVIVPSGIMLNANTTAYTASAVPSTPFTILVNPVRSWLTMGMRGGFRVDMLREGSITTISLAQYDVQAMRLVERIAFGCALPGTMVVLRTSAT